MVQKKIGALGSDKCISIWCSLHNSDCHEMKLCNISTHDLPWTCTIKFSVGPGLLGAIAACVVDRSA